MKFPSRTVAAAALAGLATAQNSNSPSAIEELTTAIEQFPELFLFRSLLAMATDNLTGSLDGKEKGVTVLVPTNDAIGQYMVANNVSTIDEVDAEDLAILLQYHVLDASLSADDFDVDDGLVIPTRLSAESSNNRTAGPQIQEQFGDSAVGQVIIASRQRQVGNSTTRRMGRRGVLHSRQSGLGALVGPIVNIRAGLEQNLQMTAVDGKWGADDTNRFQVVDQVLIPPKNCTTTIRSIAEGKLDALDKALNKAKMWPTLNMAFNVTCLAPTTDAFDRADNPEDNLDEGELKETLLLQTLKQVAYSRFLEDGMEFQSLNDFTVRVSIKDGDIFFNNAKAIKKDVLTNNGVVFTVDAVVKKLAEEEDKQDKPSGTGSDGEEDAAPLFRTIGGSFVVVLLAALSLF